MNLSLSFEKPLPALHFLALSLCAPLILFTPCMGSRVCARAPSPFIHFMPIVRVCLQAAAPCIPQSFPQKGTHVKHP
jgi:hypothetical protein